MTSQALECVVKETRPDPKYTVIWLHGLGADAYDFLPVVEELKKQGIPETRFVFPNAPERPVSMNNGYVMRAWYDIQGQGASRRENETDIRAMHVQISALIEQIISEGTPSNHIALAGFSQGGAMTYHTGLRFPHALAGLLALSTYAPLIDQITDEKHPANKNTPIFAAHGEWDDIVDISRGLTAYEKLKSEGHSIQWHTYRMDHTVVQEEVRDIAAFLNEIFGQ